MFNIKNISYNLYYKKIIILQQYYTDGVILHHEINNKTLNTENKFVYFWKGMITKSVDINILYNSILSKKHICVNENN